jgi:hypothetical protein
MNDNPRDWPEERLLAQCQWDAFRGPGPGGQKRNKTSSAVRVTHTPTGVTGSAHEMRSQQQNRKAAVERLRQRLALELRSELPAQDKFPPAWFAVLVSTAGRLRISRRDPQYFSVVGLLIDVLTETNGSVSEAAGMLRISSSNLVDFLQRDPAVLSHVNQLRSVNGLKPLGGAS